MKFFKKHKNITLLLVIIVLFVFVYFYLTKIMKNVDNKAIYGDRLEVVENVNVNTDEATKILKEKLGDIADNVTVRVQGRIIEIMVTCKAEVSRDQAKGTGQAVIESFDAEIRKVYDIQIMYSSANKENAQFPIIGYLHYGKDAISWTKDR